jgi:hypothetical protein
MTRLASVILSANVICLWLSVVAADVQTFQLVPIAEIGGFNAWRPYNNPSRLVNVGMNKGEVFAIAGKADREESYYSGGRGNFIQISDWYYVRSGFNAETTLLKFTQDTLASIISTPIQ